MITNNNYLASIAGTAINYSTFWLVLCILLIFYFIHQFVYRLCFDLMVDLFLNCSNRMKQIIHKLDHAEFLCGVYLK